MPPPEVLMLLEGTGLLQKARSFDAQHGTQWREWLKNNDAKRSNPVYAAGAAVLAEMEAALSSPSVGLHGSSASSSAQPDAAPDGHLAKTAPLTTTPPNRRRCKWRAR